LSPVISGALAPAVNANLQAVGLDTFSTANVIVSNGVAGTVTLGSVPRPTNPGEWALVAVTGGTDFSASSIVSPPWTCLPVCNSVAGGFRWLVLSNASFGNIVQRSYTNANSNQNNPLIATLWSGTPTIRTTQGLNGTPPYSFTATIAGSTLVLAFQCGGAVSPCVTNLVDSQGNKWVQVAQVTGNLSFNNAGTSFWVSSTPSSGAALTVTPTLAAGAPNPTSANFLELTGLSASQPNQPAVSNSADALGNQIVRQDAHGANLFNCSVTLTTNTTLVCQPIPASVNGVSLRAYVTDFQLNTTTAGTATAITLQYGQGGNCATGTANLSAIAYPNTSTGIVSILGVRTPLVPAASNAICATQAGTTPGTTVVELRGFLAP
jgi:hypothetical protein